MEGHLDHDHDEAGIDDHDHDHNHEDLDDDDGIVAGCYLIMIRTVLVLAR